MTNRFRSHSIVPVSDDEEWNRINGNNNFTAFQHKSNGTRITSVLIEARSFYSVFYSFGVWNLLKRRKSVRMKSIKSEPSQHIEMCVRYTCCCCCCSLFRLAFRLSFRTFRMEIAFRSTPLHFCVLLCVRITREWEINLHVIRINGLRASQRAGTSQRHSVAKRVKSCKNVV